MSKSRFKQILMPMMLPIHFKMYQQILKKEGYNAIILDSASNNVIQEGLKYVHNDTCYPAIVVIGQMIEALKNGNYKPEETAVVLTQTGGGCRASNYLHLLRKALNKANLSTVTVLSFNLSGLEKDSSIQLNVKFVRRAIAATIYGDLMMHLANQIRPYEVNKGETDKVVNQLITFLNDQICNHRGYTRNKIKKYCQKIVLELKQIKIDKRPLVKVGVVGEIYVKYSYIGNNNLEQLLASENCEVRVPGLLGFVDHCITQRFDQVKLYGGKWYVSFLAKIFYKYMISLEKYMNKALTKYSDFDLIMPFNEIREIANEVCGLGIIMGEGWLLYSEMLALCKEGFENIVCTQPFGCLPNHIVGKGMIKRIKELYPAANIVAIDYDPSATKVNQENRIKLMLSVAKK